MLEVLQKCLKSSKQERMDETELKNRKICTGYTFRHHIAKKR